MPSIHASRPSGGPATARLLAAGAAAAAAGQAAAQSAAAQPLAARPMTAAQASRFLHMATFGPTRTSLAALQAMSGVGAWLDQQFALPIGARLADAVVRQVQEKHPLPSPCFGPATSETIVHHAWGRFVTAEDQLRKRVAAALLEIFVINERVGFIGLQNNQVTAASFLDMLETHAFGNFRQLLEGVSLHPAMGNFLSHIGNRKAAYGADGVEIRVPDENYARELLQLFSIGLYELNLDGSWRLDNRGQPIETYRQDDVFQLARVFTGWNYDPTATGVARHQRPMVADPAQHSPEAKHFLGARIPRDTGPVQSLKLALDEVFRHPNVGPFIGRQLIQRLVCSNPSPAYVARVAQAFNRNGAGLRGDMKAVIRAILTDAEALTPGEAGVPLERRGKVREPMMRLIALARVLEARSDQRLFPIGDLSDSASGLGQSPFLSPSVFNFFRPGYVPPSSELAANGCVAPELQICTGTQVIGSINTCNRFIANDERVFHFAAWADWRARATDVSGLIDHAVLMLTGHGQGFFDQHRERIRAAVTAIPASQADLRVRTVLQLVASSQAFLVQT